MPAGDFGNPRMFNLREEPGIDTLNPEGLSGSPVSDVPAIIRKVDTPHAEINGAFGRKEPAHGVNLFEVENIGRSYVGHTLDSTFKEHDAVSLPNGAHNSHNTAAFREMLIV